MSSYFYFTRHGQTIWNVENKICGATDIALTELGHKQAIELGECIKMGNIHIDEILYSPLIRAADTAKHISETAGIPCRMDGTTVKGAEFWKIRVYTKRWQGICCG